MLTPQEEATLKRLAAEHTPLPKPPMREPRTAPEANSDLVTEQFFASLDSKKLETLNPCSDAHLESILKRAGFAGMSAGEAFSLGLTKKFLLANWNSPEPIRAAILAARKANEEQGIVEPRGSLTFSADPRASLPRRAIRTAGKIIMEVFGNDET